MTTVPKLTDSQAAILRCVTADLGDLVVLTRSGMLDQNGRDITALGRDALAAYDAEQRERILREELAKVLSYRMEGSPKDRDDVLSDQRKAIKAIRAEAMREVHDMIRTTRNAHVDHHLRALEVMIAKEEA